MQQLLGAGSISAGGGNQTHLREKRAIDTSNGGL